MRAKRSRVLVGLVLAGILVPLAIFFAPAQLGGSSTYTATVGDSMEPLFHKGDLAVTRPAPSYRVGDIVLYESPVFHRPVLHRILVIQHGRYFFKGDNNQFVDPGWVPRDALLGKLWIHIPRAGRALSWLGKPSHSAALAGLAVIVLVGGGAGGNARRSRRGRRRRGSRWKRPAPVKAHAVKAHAAKAQTLMRHFHRPRKSAENIAAGIIGALALVLLVLGFTHPVKKPAQVGGAYRSSGTFSYRAHVDKPVTTYPTGVAHPGEPLFLDYFKTLQLGFTYRFASHLDHEVHGTIGLNAIMSSDTSWHRAFQLAKPRGFTGDKAVAKGQLDLQQLRQLMLEVATASGAVGANYTIDLQPVVRVRGKVGHKKLDETFSPTLPMTLSQTVLNIDASAPAPPPGAAYAQPSPQSALNAALNPVRAGSVSGVAPEYVKLVHFRLPVSTARGLGLGLLALTLLILFTKPLKRRRREVWSPERRIAHRYDCVIVDVVSITDGAVATAAPTEIPDFESLATLARYCERPILRENGDAVQIYAVEDGGRLYVYRAVPRPQPQPQPQIEAPAPVVERVVPAPPVVQAAPIGQRPSRTVEAAPIRQRRRLPSLVRFGAPMLILVATLVSAAAFTGGNTVPVSYAGVSSKAASLGQIAPTQCGSIALSNLVVGTGTSATGTSGSDLVLGPRTTGTVTLTGKNSDDCIVAGGGAGTTNNIDGGNGTGDVCIGAPGATNNFTNCEATY